MKRENSSAFSNPVQFTVEKGNLISSGVCTACVWQNPGFTPHMLPKCLL